jgi:hypothetical protein
VLTAPYLYRLLVPARLDKAALDRWFHVAASKGGDLAEDARDLDAVVQEEAKFTLRGATLLVRNQTEHVYKQRHIVDGSNRSNVLMSPTHICTFPPAAPGTGRRWQS